MKVIMGADHQGYELKTKLSKALTAVGFDMHDVGAATYNRQDDYLDFALPVARAVAKNKQARGILICKNGVGVCVVANKVRGVRATVSTTKAHAVSARHDDDVNVLCLGARFVSDRLAMQITTAFLRTSFSKAVRHVRRLKKVNSLGGR